MFSEKAYKGYHVELRIEGGVAVLKESTWQPGFGRSVLNKKLEINIVDSKLLTRIQWRSA